MKVMGSAILVFQAIVIGLTIPVAVAVYGVEKSTALWVAGLLMLLCILAVGGVRRDRRTAVTTGLIVQAVILGSSFFIPPMLFTGILFLLIWLLAFRLSAQTDAAIARKQALQSQGESQSDISS